jgi:hypothetical protein
VPPAVEPKKEESGDKPGEAKDPPRDDEKDGDK